jgi:hypothetical protein
MSMPTGHCCGELSGWGDTSPEGYIASREPCIRNLSYVYFNDPATGLRHHLEFYAFLLSHRPLRELDRAFVISLGYDSCRAIDEFGIVPP